MITPEAQADNDKKDCEDFLTKLAALVSEYRYKKLPTGHIVGALEIVKHRTLLEANQTAEKMLAKMKGQS